MEYAFGAMTASISSGNIALDHDRRAFTPGNADPALVHQNEDLLTLPSSDLGAAFNNIFRPAVEEYNAKLKAKGEKHADRYKDSETYYKEYVAAHPDTPAIREVVYAIGNHDTNPPIPLEGETEDVFQDRLKMTKKVYRKIFEDWKQDNPNLVPISAVIHADEPNGTVHMHITYICIGTGYKRGLAMQPSVRRAFECMGIKREWAETINGETGKTEKKPLYEVSVWKRDKALPKLVALMEENGFQCTAGDSKGRKHLTVYEFKTAMDMEREEEEIRMERERIVQERRALEKQKKDLRKLKDSLQKEYERRQEEQTELYIRRQRKLLVDHQRKMDVMIQRRAMLEDEYKKKQEELEARYRVIMDQLEVEHRARMEELEHLISQMESCLSADDLRLYARMGEYVAAAKSARMPAPGNPTVHEYLLSHCPTMSGGGGRDIEEEAVDVAMNAAVLQEAIKKASAAVVAAGRKPPGT